MINSTHILAIVIPAYKDTYLRDALNSLVQQTNKDFTVYIGDDASPNNIKSIVDEFRNKLPIVYKSFSHNLGKINLAEQWNRCIDLVKSEKWIWLFSDDDIMDANCVSSFFETIEGRGDYDVYHFNINIIDEDKRIVNKCMKYPEILSSEEFFESRIKSKFYSFAVEYIFRKDVFYREGKFESFDMAWGTDDATWIKFSRYTGIKTIPDAKVYWRLSNSNISSIKNNYEILDRKFKSNVSYLDWVINYFKNNNINDKTNIYDKHKWFINQIKTKDYLCLRKQIKYVMYFNQTFKSYYLNLYSIPYLILFKAYKLIKSEK
jgi:glycosyltransferase involved in cell wall biosynthesis